MDIAFSMRAINEVLTEPTMNYEIGLDGSMLFHLPDEILFDGCWYSHFFLPLSSWVFTRLSILGRRQSDRPYA